MKAPVISGISVAALCTAGWLSAQGPLPLGDQFQVNTYTSDIQWRPAVVAEAGGDFVVVWHSYGSSGTDYSDYSIQGQRFDATGNVAGGEFQVNTYTTSGQSYPSIGADANGNFVVVWHSLGSSGTDISSYSIQGQRFDAVGNTVGGEFQVNTYTTSYQDHPAVAVDTNGDFVVVWRSYGSSGTDISSYSIQGQRFDAAGNAVGGEFQINTYTTSYQDHPAVAVDTNGDFVVVWQSYGSSGTDISSYSYSIQGQRFDAAGSTIGGEFQINTYTTDNQLEPSAAAGAGGSFIVVWHSYGSSDTDVSGYSVQGQRFDSAGSAVGGEFQINTYTTSFQSYPTATVDADGEFVVVWHSSGSSGTDTWNLSVQGQRFDETGSTLGGEFQINTYTPTNQSYPAVATDAAGDFVVVWHSYGGIGTDNDSYSIQAQRLSMNLIFEDGFESGDTSDWSSTVP